MAGNGLSIYLSYLLRHNPDDLSLTMDCHGWVSVEALLDGINARGKYNITRAVLESIVENDSKGRYKFSEDGHRVKACQGHSVPWVQPELDYKEPPAILYHGTTWSAYKEILQSGSINKMSRHAVHLTATENRAWQSARRRKTRAVVLRIDARKMHNNGYSFGVSENDVWCADTVPVEFIVDVLVEDGKGGSRTINQRNSGD